MIRKRYDYLLDNHIECIPLTKNAVKIALSLLQEFADKYNLKSKFRNSLNDIVILSSAIDSAAILMTDDLLLKEFSADKCQVPVSQEGPFSLIDFTDCSNEVKRIRAESKGYINRGWQVQFRNNGYSLKAT
jgi:hypothetical protein